MIELGNLLDWKKFLSIIRNYSPTVLDFKLLQRLQSGLEENGDYSYPLVTCTPRPKISMSYKGGVHYDLFAQKFIIHPYLNILDIAS